MKIALIAVAVVLSGCAARPGIVQGSDGTLIALRRGTMLGDATGPLRIEALKDANDYCATMNKRANVIRSREIPAISHWPEAQVSFTCE